MSTRSITVVLDEATLARMAAVRSTLTNEERVVAMLKLGLLNAESRKRRDVEIKQALEMFRKSEQ